MTKLRHITWSRGLPIKLIAVGYIAGHLPVLLADRVAPMHLLQLAIICWFGYTLVVSEKFRNQVGKLIEQYQELFISLILLLSWAIISFVWGSYSSISGYKIILLGAGIIFGGAVFILLQSSKQTAVRTLQLMIYAGVALAIFSIWQFIGDNIGAPHWLTQIVPGGHWDQIDFSRSNGLSEEPQYLTTVLLLPASLLYFFVTTRTKHWHWLSWVAVDIAVLLSLSRGGFLAHGFLALLWVGYWLTRRQWRLIGWRIATSAVALVITLGLIGWSGSLPGHKGAEWTVRRYIEQASSGLLPLHTNFVQDQNPSGPVVNQFEDPKSDNSPEGRDEIGVVEESTISRLETYRQGLKIWLANPLNFIFGVGYGSIGSELHDRFNKGYTDKSLVNNQPIQLVAELGLVGLMIVAFLIWQFVRVFHRSRVSTPIKLMVAGLLLATAVQFLFYSAFHLPQLWLVIALSLYLLNKQQSARVRV